MSIEAYTNPDFGWNEKGIFFLVTLLGLALCVLVITVATKIGVMTSGKNEEEEKPLLFYEKAHNRVQRFYEMIIAGTSVMSFSCAYVIINHIDSLVQAQGTDNDLLFELTQIWENGRDFVLLLLIVISCVLNTLLDKLIIPLKHPSSEEKASVRMLAMFYVIIILIYLNRIGDSSEYSPVMIYYLGLMVGRFVYFDASFRDFLTAVKNLFHNLYLLILGLALASLLCTYGFLKEYLLERNYIIVGLFYTHLFMLAAVFLLHHSHILHLFVRNPERKKKKKHPRREDPTETVHPIIPVENYDMDETEYADDYDDPDDTGYENETVDTADPEDTTDPYYAEDTTDMYRTDDTKDPEDTDDM